MKLHEAEKLALQILKQVMEEKISPTNVELAVIPVSTCTFKKYPADEVEAIIATLTSDSLSL